MQIAEPSAYKIFMQQSALIAPRISRTLPSISAPLNVATTAPQRSGSAQNLSATPSPIGPHEWRGFSEYEIQYGIRVMGRHT